MAKPPLHYGDYYEAPTNVPKAIRTAKDRVQTTMNAEAVTDERLRKELEDIHNALIRAEETTDLETAVQHLNEALHNLTQLRQTEGNFTWPRDTGAELEDDYKRRLLALETYAEAMIRQIKQQQEQRDPVEEHTHEDIDGVF